MSLPSSISLTPHSPFLSISSHSSSSAFFQPYTSFPNQVPLIHPLAVARALTPQPLGPVSFEKDEEEEEADADADDTEDAIRFNARKKKHEEEEKKKNEEPAPIDAVMIMTYDYSSSRRQCVPFFLYLSNVM